MRTIASGVQYATDFGGSDSVARRAVRTWPTLPSTRVSFAKWFAGSATSSNAMRPPTAPGQSAKMVDSTKFRNANPHVTPSTDRWYGRRALRLPRGAVVRAAATAHENSTPSVQISLREFAAESPVHRRGRGREILAAATAHGSCAVANDVHAKVSPGDEGVAVRYGAKSRTARASRALRQGLTQSFGRTLGLLPGSPVGCPPRLRHRWSMRLPAAGRMRRRCPCAVTSALWRSARARGDDRRTQTRCMGVPRTS